ncbi:MULTISPECIES: nucleotide pyrophosphohydrolase [Lysobacteraceae]|uniref:Nucleotide pyrophosphohydrolase n=1 Tax=Novilysobacter avium TaxID=2781023 RepID=A0A7S6ULX1_9GAMM|nr:MULTISPECIES: nucleotide pyrophosphohydrolase [Lysobacter]QOW22738.1 nucleotide pyrophosphohydrolase [Lysobacter avium]QOW25246.1 nucleotide pyrophosphohydrolase [Lysobacter sp. H23M47]
MTQDIETLRNALREFAEARDWKQFHSPKNLAMALSVEAAELLEHFQWLTDEQSRSLSSKKHEQVSDEIADVFIYVLQLADKLSVDPVAAAWRKMKKNGEKYPVDLAKGQSTKYTDLPSPRPGDRKP